MYRLNGMLQDLGIANEIGETIAIASFIRNGRLSLLISGPYLWNTRMTSICAYRRHLECNFITLWAAEN
jgi:hypothetical protein